MKNSIITLALTLIFLSTLTPAFAADSSAEKHWTVYERTGWFLWDEQTNGKRFIKDEGMMYALGITRTDRIYKSLSLTETVEFVGGHPYYDGQKNFSDAPLHMTNVYLGTREEIRASVRVPAMGLTFDPFAGIAHKLFGRVVEGELWNILYAPAGMRVGYQFSSISTFVEAGVTIPLSTSNYLSGKNQGRGYENFTLHPKARMGQFAEAGVTYKSFSLSLAYEATKFDKSDEVVSKSLNGNGDSRFWQPE
jgi:hypothetical protein